LLLVFRFPVKASETYSLRLDRPRANKRFPLRGPSAFLMSGHGATAMGGFWLWRLH